jgi:tryptophan synthase alpha chain
MPCPYNRVRHSVSLFWRHDPLVNKYMNRIDQKFKELRQANKKAFIAFITAGDPDLDTTEELVLALEKAGADIVEIGVPFSDPLADGPTIQAASYRSLQKGTTVKKILAVVKRIRQRSQVPLALMTYYNPVFHFGEKSFVEQAKASGVDGVIIPDLPLEEAGELRRFAMKEDLSTIFFVAPTTTADRLKPVVKAATGFIYYVSVAGVTGARKAVPAEIAIKIRQVKALTDKPVCVGFGVSTPEQARMMARVADGVIVGSAIVNEIHKNADAKDLAVRIEAFVSALVKAVK